MTQIQLMAININGNGVFKSLLLNESKPLFFPVLLNLTIHMMNHNALMYI